MIRRYRIWRALRQLARDARSLRYRLPGAGEGRDHVREICDQYGHAYRRRRIAVYDGTFVRAHMCSTCWNDRDVLEGQP
jgi:hypothetical protein